MALFEYLIKTYTNKGDIVLDNCMGSGTTAIACLNTERNFIGFETNEEYYNKSLQRIKNNVTQLDLFEEYPSQIRYYAKESLEAIGEKID